MHHDHREWLIRSLSLEYNLFLKIFIYLAVSAVSFELFRVFIFLVALALLLPVGFF